MPQNTTENEVAAVLERPYYKREIERLAREEHDVEHWDRMSDLDREPWRASARKRFLIEHHDEIEREAESEHDWRIFGSTEE
jgi:hypothetical protein